MLAGTNGAGKSSVAGAMFRQAGADYFNPDEATARILAANPDISAADANSAAWHQGKRLRERAIAERLDFAFETTLGGHTVSALLHEALAAGIDVRMRLISFAQRREAAWTFSGLCGLKREFCTRCCKPHNGLAARSAAGDSAN